MYPSNSYFAVNNNNNPNLIPSYPLDHIPHKPSIYQINPNSKQEDPLLNSLYYNIPCPYSHCEDNDAFIQHMCDFYLQQKSEITEANAPDPITTEMAEGSNNIKEILGECNSNQNQSAVIKEIPKKRTSKKDRHSKIETAQGPRDRRMRLSLKVARDFFNLQDTLGYNKASKTVEWLLSKAKDAIKDLTSCSANSPSSTSECEVVSQEKDKHLVSPSKDTKSPRVSIRKSAINTLTKESREKARERARERTREKRKRDGSKSGLETTMSHQMKPLGFWCQDNNNNDCQLERLVDVGELSLSMIFNYDMHSNGVPQEHQFRDFNLYGKQWDAFNNTNPR